MVDRTGLFVKPLPGSPPQGTAPTDGRLVLGALFGTGGGCLTGGTMTASATAMQVTIAAAVWRIPDPTNTAGVYLSPADAATLTFSAGPASGSRIDVIWVRQNNYEASDANSRVVYGVAAGTAASSPVAPAIPAGAMKIGQITVPTGVSNAAACILVPTFNGASVLRPQIAVVSEGQLPATGDYIGQLAYVAQASLGTSTIPVVERWSGSGWQRWDSDWATYTPGYQNVNWSFTLAQFRYRSGSVLMRLQGTVSSNSGNGQPILISSPTGMGGSVTTSRVWMSGGGGRNPMQAELYNGGLLQFYRTVAPETLVTTASPVNWGAGDSITARIEYDPA